MREDIGVIIATGGKRPSDRVEFKKPKGLEFPEGADPKEGEYFMVKLAESPDNKSMLCIKEIEGIKMPGYETEVAEEGYEKPDFGGMVKGGMDEEIEDEEIA